jgi:serine/threonine protein kinase
MDGAPLHHPTGDTLSSYGLGKLDEFTAQAVSMHLEHCPECRRQVSELSADSFLDRVRDAQAVGMALPEEAQPDETESYGRLGQLAPAPPDTSSPGLLDHPDYEIKRELGRGGMGVVYLAHNTWMGRDEVLKVIGRRIVERPEVSERFLREIRALAKLRHPNVVAAYHATRLGESIVFSMEYVEGLDLSELVKAKGPLPVAHACNFVSQAARGLQHAHEEGFVHRDIKPSNLMLTRRGDEAVVLVLDFGLAKMSYEDLTNVRMEARSIGRLDFGIDGPKSAREEMFAGGLSPGLTSPGQRLGTPGYMAPEQIQNPLSVDIRADIYSLGCTLYCLLTGHAPFQANSIYEFFSAQNTRDADPLDVVCPDVPNELGTLVARMMAQDPARRFQTPGELVQAISPFCRNGNAFFRGSKAKASKDDTANSSRSVDDAVSRAFHLGTNVERRMWRPCKRAHSSVAESWWENVIELRKTETPTEVGPKTDPDRWISWARLRWLSGPTLLRQPGKCSAGSATRTLRQAE